tara:strand:+ start:129072 stop:129341 length:270 start_codon:yes stop_codon:yes gene_type:complete
MHKPKQFRVKGEDFEIASKRLYLPIIIELICPHCGEKITSDLESDYLSYPVINHTEQIHFYCNECDNESEIDYKLRVSLDVDMGSIRKL